MSKTFKTGDMIMIKPGGYFHGQFVAAWKKKPDDICLHIIRKKKAYGVYLKPFMRYNGIEETYWHEVLVGEEILIFSTGQMHVVNAILHSQ